MGDKRFRKCVIYLCVHDAEQAMGIIINKPKPDLKLSGMLPHLGIQGDVTNDDSQILYGGPVETERGFVLHSRDYFNIDTSLPLSETLALSTSKDILTALISDHAPKLSALALGYTGWHGGQLEDEIKNNGWLITNADENIIFSGDPKHKWKQALASLGISPELLSAQAGNA
ncbi:MAG: YqgE/AlgH family protein [Robiginitomaculum sp.]|nr:YqgE/AlgH family protein [Robiginitomaculum sp.]